MRLAFDLETDGLLRGLSQIHCLVTQDLDTGEVIRYDDTNNTRGWIHDGINILEGADEIWGHNIIGYDIEVIKQLCPYFNPEGKVYDTLILSRLFFTDMLDRDFKLRPPNMPAQLYGRHSLESWGYRLGVLKSEYGKQLSGDWSHYTPEMLEYCARDVEVSVALAKLFEPKLAAYDCTIELEHEVAKIMAWQERQGFPFDVTKGHQLESRLRQELEKISEQMRSTFAFVDGGSFTPKRPNSTRGYVAGAEMCKLKEFNPTSRDHIAWAFQIFRGWEPTEFTNTGRPKIDESVLKAIGTEEALGFARILELQKHLGQLSEGANAWLKLVDSEDRIHHSCMLNTNTGRMAHMRPNLAQVPSDHDYRELFGPGEGRVQVGADASGLELRCLAHFLHRFDGGAFGKTLLEGDIHQSLADIYGTDRKTGKSVTYCLIYGGGDKKLGLTAGASKSNAIKKGKEIRKRIMTGLAGFAELSSAVASRAETGVLKGLDGRPIRIQGKNHAALNYLLQSSGAIVTKVWLVEAYKRLQEASVDFYPLAYVHDEVQLSVAPSDVSRCEEILTQTMIDVQQLVGFKCPLAAEAQHGQSWADCH